VIGLAAGRLPRTVCRNGGPVLPAVGTGPYPLHFPRPFLDLRSSRRAASKWVAPLCPYGHRVRIAPWGATLS